MRMQNKPIRAVAFDLDDTLWCTATTLGAASQKLIEYLQASVPALEGIQIADLVAENKLIRTSHPDKAYDWNFIRRKSLENILGRHGKANLKEEAYNAYYVQRNQPAFFKGAVDCVHRVKEAGFLISSFTDGNANPYLIKEIASVFDVHVSAIEAGAGKPDKRMYNLLMSKLGVTADEILVVGDNYEKDVLGAKAAGMRAVWVPIGSKDGEMKHSIEEADCAADLVLPGGVKDLTLDALISLQTNDIKLAN